MPDPRTGTEVIISSWSSNVGAALLVSYPPPAGERAPLWPTQPIMTESNELGGQVELSGLYLDR